jgi:hypothetical protein
MLRTAITAAALALVATAAAAKPQTNRPDITTVCVDVNGEMRSPICRQHLATRIEPTDDICTCPRGNRVQASVCPPGVAGPPDSLEANRARNDILRNQNNLIGAMWQGQPLCVPVH